MKIAQTVLLVLIIVGAVLLFTQKIWVPRLVDAILKYEGGKYSPSTEVN